MKRLALVILGVVIILGAIRSYRLYQDSSPTPNDAVKDYIVRITSNSPRKIASLKVVSQSSRPGNEQILLFQAYDHRFQTHVVGYTIIKKSVFGWYVDNFQMTSKSPLPTDVMAGVNGSESIPIVYGQVFVADAASVEAIFSDPNQGNITISSDLPKGSFVVFGPRYSELTTFKILDGNGNVLKQFTGDELQNG